MNTYEKCKNCGADYGLHHYQTLQCPVGGSEETREGHKQEYMEQRFVPKLNEYITTATVYFHADPSVGIRAYSYEAQVPKLTRDKEDREFIRQRLIDAYTQIDAEFKPVVTFDDEDL